jgi:uncharacterized RDD family membrane protein YckC
MTTLWFYAERGVQQGPASEEDLRRRFLRGELPGETLVWSEGMARWAPAQRVAALTQAPPSPPPPVPQVGPLAVAVAGRPSALRTTTASQVLQVHRPWARFLARMADGILFQLVVLLALPVAWKPDPADVLGVNVYFIGISIASLIAWTFVEAFFLAAWGMTPGKWMYQVRVMHPEGRRLHYGEALARSLHVLFSGIACGLPGVPLITMALAYRELMETGTTAWDRRHRFAIQHGVQKPIHQAVVFALVGLILYGTFQTLAASGN